MVKKLTQLAIYLTDAERAQLHQLNKAFSKSAFLHAGGSKQRPIARVIGAILSTFLVEYAEDIEKEIQLAQIEEKTVNTQTLRYLVEDEVLGVAAEVAKRARAQLAQRGT